MTAKIHPLKAIRGAGVPLVAYETADPAQTILACVKALNGKADTTAVVEWNVASGHSGLNKPGQELAKHIGAEPVQDPSVFLTTLAQLAQSVVGEKGVTRAEDALVFMHNGHRFLQSELVVQAVWNLRDAFKAVGATLVLLCPSAMLPVELQQDVVIVTEPLPTSDEVSDIVDSICKDAGVKVEHKDKVVDTLLGVSAFAAEQALAMSVTKDGVDRDSLWERKRKMVEQTPGLSVFRGAETFAGVGGCANIKKFLARLLKSKNNPVRCIGFIDEIEKMFAGNAGDLSGVSQDQLMVFLREMQDSNIPGMIFIGPPGTAKSAVAKAAGSIAEAEVLSIDTGAMTGSLVGESQSKIRKALATFKAVSQGKGLFIATCNKIASLPPELRRRFTLGTFFFDLPSKDERAAIWKIHMAAYQFDADTLLPDDEGWTGAEIKACCDIAWRTESSLLDAAKFIVPVSKSAGDSIEALRQMASGRFVSASKDGIYEHESKGVPTGQKIQVTQTLTAQEIEQPKNDKE